MDPTPCRLLGPTLAAEAFHNYYYFHSLIDRTHGWDPLDARGATPNPVAVRRLRKPTSCRIGRLGGTETVAQ